ncbi:patatin-like phospholipase family protein [Ideonella sp.]|uniref:patatin-like phospholipase family protein n=1 Tax=Ideonella sp. TaxID=1929293 RepID=UPI0037BEAEA4
MFARLIYLLSGLLLALPPLYAADVAAATQAHTRPRIGLVLSGGGARGFAHIGVLKALERQGIVIDAIAGTSMGAIVGGLYASGMSADEIERELLWVNWNLLFAPRVSRQQLSQRRKEEDFEIATAVELGFRDGEFRAPQGTVSSRGLETLLRRYTLPVRAVQHFDQLPIPYRAVATDMETGDAVILDKGDLATAMRSSMSVPGVFPPIEVDGRVLGDGGLVNNLPVDVVRAMGVDVVIAVNIGTPLSGRDTLNSVIGLTAQMVNILTEQNVKRSLATLGAYDVLIAPDLGSLTAADFDRTKDFIAAGEQGAQAHQARLAALGRPSAQYAQWRQARKVPEPPPVVLDFVAFEGTELTNPARFANQMQSRPGELFDPAAAARDVRALAATGDYVRVDYHLAHTTDGHGLVLDMEDKHWGPNYLRVGLDLSTDFSGRSAFNIKLSHNRHWLTANGTEWRNRVQIGETPQVFSEIYHPLTRTIGTTNDWFVSGHVLGERRLQTLFDAQGVASSEWRRSSGRLGLDVGQPWGSFGEFRLGLMLQGGHNSPLLLGANFKGSAQSDSWRETGLRLRAVVDQLDFANFPQSGYRLEGEAVLGRRTTEQSSRMARLEGQATLAWTRGAHTLNLHGVIKAADAQSDSLVGPYTLGGFQQLSGYRPGQVAGNALMLGRLGWYMRVAQPPIFARALFVGASAELGQAWASRRDMTFSGLRGGGSLYLGADTGIGPMYLGLTWAPDGEPGLALFIGRP